MTYFHTNKSVGCSIVHKALFKIQTTRLSRPFHSNSIINIIIPYLRKSCFSIAKILKLYNFKEVFSQLTNSLSKLKDPINTLNYWVLIVFLIKVVCLTLDKQNVDFVSVYLINSSPFRLFTNASCGLK